MPARPAAEGMLEGAPKRPNAQAERAAGWGTRSAVSGETRRGGAGGAVPSAFRIPHSAFLQKGRSPTCGRSLATPGRQRPPLSGEIGGGKNWPAPGGRGGEANVTRCYACPVGVSEAHPALEGERNASGAVRGVRPVRWQLIDAAETGKQSAHFVRGHIQFTGDLGKTPASLPKPSRLQHSLPVLLDGIARHGQRPSQKTSPATMRVANTIHGSSELDSSRTVVGGDLKYDTRVTIELPAGIGGDGNGGGGSSAAATMHLQRRLRLHSGSGNSGHSSIGSALSASASAAGQVSPGPPPSNTCT
jgi:hypothetical protein